MEGTRRPNPQLWFLWTSTDYFCFPSNNIWLPYPHLRRQDNRSRCFLFSPEPSFISRDFFAPETFSLSYSGFAVLPSHFFVNQNSFRANMLVTEVVSKLNVLLLTIKLFLVRFSTQKITPPLLLKPLQLCNCRRPRKTRTDSRGGTSCVDDIVEDH